MLGELNSNVPRLSADIPRSIDNLTLHIPLQDIFSSHVDSLLCMISAFNLRPSRKLASACPESSLFLGKARQESFPTLRGAFGTILQVATITYMILRHASGPGGGWEGDLPVKLMKWKRSQQTRCMLGNIYSYRATNQPPTNAKTRCAEKFT